MSCTRLIERLMTVEEAACWVTDEELRLAATFGSERRRREYLSWRAVVRRQLGREVEIAYNEVGAPYLVGRSEHLSVAHGADRVAVVIADHAVGIDIERLDRRFEQIRSRYLTPAEEQLSDDPHFLAVAWCAKEALYKRAGRMGVDFKRDMQIVAVERADDGSSWHLRAVVFGEQTVELHAVSFDAEHVIVYTL